MAKGRQIYLQADEIEKLASLVDWEIVRLDTDRQDLIRTDLSYAIRRIRSRGKKPERSDFDPRMPDPETDYKLALQQWEHWDKHLWQVIGWIRENRRDVAYLRNLLSKMWYR